MSFRDWFNIIVIGITITGIAIGRLPVYRMNRATIALVGTTLLIVTNAVRLSDAYRSVDMNTIVLLFSMMVITANLHLSLIIEISGNTFPAFQWYTIW